MKSKDCSVKNKLMQFALYIIVSLLVLVVLLINEAILRYIFGMSALNIDIRHLYPYILLPMGLLLIDSRRALFWVLVAISALQLIWFGTYRYFGSVLGPDLILLGREQMFEIGIAATGEWQIFVLPVILVIVLNVVFAIFVHYVKGDRFDPLTRLGVFLVVLPFMIISVRSFVHSRPFVLNPSPYMPSHTGVVQAVSLAIRSGLADSQFSDRRAPKLVVGASLEGALDEPITVAVIMGESISPMELGIFGADKATTPLMTKRFSSGNGLRYIPKVGLAAGTATLASVPLFIRMSFNPVAAFRRSSTIFEMAHKQKFSVGYYSAQNIKPLQIAGGLKFIDKIETKEDWEPAYEAKRDAVILDQMDKAPIGGDKRFYFIHQRTNHGPYVCNIKGPLTDRTDVRGTKTSRQKKANQAASGLARLKRYRRGLLCYDKSLDELLSRLEKQRGALYIFITADHNELMGEKGMWGHSNLVLQGALVPMILATNRPDSDIARRFSKLRVPTSFEFMQLVSRTLGQEVHLAQPTKKTYVNGVMAYGRRGYIEFEKTDEIDQFQTSIIMPDNERSKPKIEAIEGLQEILAYLKKYSQPKMAEKLN